jgi:hypothetical protein
MRRGSLSKLTVSQPSGTNTATYPRPPKRPFWTRKNPRSPPSEPIPLAATAKTDARSPMAAASAGQCDTSTPLGSSGRVPLEKVTGKYEAAEAARVVRPSGVRWVIVSPSRRSYAARRPAGTCSIQNASTSPTLPTVLVSSCANRGWLGDGSPASAAPRPTT